MKIDDVQSKSRAIVLVNMDQLLDKTDEMSRLKCSKISNLYENILIAQTTINT